MVRQLSKCSRIGKLNKSVPGKTYGQISVYFARNRLTGQSSLQLGCHNNLFADACDTGPEKGISHIMYIGTHVYVHGCTCSPAMGKV